MKSYTRGTHSRGFQATTKRFGCEDARWTFIDIWKKAESRQISYRVLWEDKFQLERIFSSIWWQENCFLDADPSSRTPNWYSWTSWSRKFQSWGTYIHIIMLLSLIQISCFIWVILLAYSILFWSAYSCTKIFAVILIKFYRKSWKSWSYLPKNLVLWHIWQDIS